MIDLLDIVRDELTRSRHPFTTRNPTFYPSSASAVGSDGVTYGACARADWYRLCGVKPTDPPNFYMIMVYHLGKAVETKVVEGMKKAGFYETEGTKFFIPSLNVSGELDIVGRWRRPDKSIGYYGVEVKSVYSQGAVATISGRSRAYKGQKAFPPYPKESNLMQVMIYLGEFCLNASEDKKLDFFKLLYLPRDKPVDGREYTISLVTREELSGSLTKFFNQMKPSEHYALVQTKDFPDQIETRFSLEDIYSSYSQKFDQMQKNEIFPRSFEKFYSAEKIEQLFESEEIGKTAYEDWVKAGRPKASMQKTPGHYLCQSYCEWRSFCYKANGTPNPEADLVSLPGRS